MTVTVEWYKCLFKKFTWLCKVTASSSSSERGGISVKASRAASSGTKKTSHMDSRGKCLSGIYFGGSLITRMVKEQKDILLFSVFKGFSRFRNSQFFSWYSMAALRLKASMRAVSCRVRVLPTLRTSIPSVVMPTLSSGCSRIPRSMMSAALQKYT